MLLGRRRRGGHRALPAGRLVPQMLVLVLVLVVSPGLGRAALRAVVVVLTRARRRALRRRGSTIMVGCH